MFVYSTTEFVYLFCYKSIQASLMSFCHLFIFSLTAVWHVIVFSLTVVAYMLCVCVYIFFSNSQSYFYYVMALIQ